MKIDIKTKECLYIKINGWTYYIDDSTGEQIISKWNEDIKDNESICSECDKKINDDVETKWDLNAEPYCKKCYNKDQPTK